MLKSNIVFSVNSSVDLGISLYTLDEKRYAHIVLGHRDLAPFMIRGVQSTVEELTHIFRSTYNSARYSFVSNNITSSSGKPMNVIVERHDMGGSIITASIRKSTSGELVWTAKSGLYTTYDETSDVLYFSSGDSRSAYAEDSDLDERIWLRSHEDDNSPAGVTLFDAASLIKEREREIIELVSGFLSISPAYVETKIQSLR